MLPIKTYIQHPNIFFYSLLLKLNFLFPDKLYLLMIYRLKMGKRLNLKNPQTFNEKLQWLKLYNRRPEYTRMVDKYAVKEYVTSIIGSQYVIPTLGVWEKPEQIDWYSLPNQFVLKTTHGGGGTGVVICKDKQSFNKDEAIVKLNRSLKSDIYKSLREWPYKNVRKRVIAEQYMEDSKTKELRDYKFFCFNGQVKALFVATDRQTPGEEVKFDFFDAEYNHLPFRQGHDNAKEVPSKPRSFVEMKRLAEKLSKGIPQVRIDFYEVNGSPLVGEITFSHFAGMVPFEPMEWDLKFGNWITLPNERIV